MTEFATIPASAWNSVPAPMIVLCFLIVVLVMGFLPQIIRVITGKDRRAISVSNDLNQQAMNLMGGVAEELAKERVSHVQARRDADRGWWLARHWNGECWRLLGCWRNSAALVFSTRMALLVLIEKYNDVQSDSMKKIDVPEWASIEDGHMHPIETQRPPDLPALEAPMAPNLASMRLGG